MTTSHIPRYGNWFDAWHWILFFAAMQYGRVLVDSVKIKLLWHVVLARLTIARQKVLESGRH
ncbi:MAG: hypothetical protein GY703_16800 [Gammaproteobacteria bacterium]|nr:hypothetical protein [Gammaproteobacteria bacterium]